MFYLVQRTDCEAFTIARDLDPAYGTAFDKARQMGVELLCYGTRITPDDISLGPRFNL